MTISINRAKREQGYFFCAIPVTAAMEKRIDLSGVLGEMRTRGGGSRPDYARHLANRLNQLPERLATPVPAGTINLFGLLEEIFHHVIEQYEEDNKFAALTAVLVSQVPEIDETATRKALADFARRFPGQRDRAAPVAAAPVDPGNRLMTRELLLLRLAAENPALDSFRQLFDDSTNSGSASWRDAAAAIDRGLESAPPVASLGDTLPEILRAPAKASPHSLAGQIEYIKERWRAILPAELLDELLIALDIVREEERAFFSGPGRPQVLQFPKRGGLGRSGYDYPEFERFSPDADWMPNVVMIAKMVYVWLDQLSRKYERIITRLDQVPDEELDALSRWGFSALWLIGLWERSAASAKIKRIGGNPDAISSAYSLYDYVIAADLGGEAALDNLRERCQSRGIRLASDMVPNHTGIYSRWTVEHPDWFVQLEYPPYPAYNFNGPDLSFSPEVSLHIEDGYWDRRDAAVVFKHYDHRNGRTRFIYHGNDGTSTPWNDTAQLNYLLAEVREAVIGTILHVARQFPIIRFDAAMTLAKKHYQRLWYPQPGHGSGVPSRSEHGMSREEFDRVFPEEFWREVVDRVAAEAPGTLLLAEAFWLMEGYFVRTLGMHRVYNSAFMNMLKMEENAKYRQTVKNVLEYDHRILQRFVNFMNNPDERTAVEQFGKEGKYFGACVLLVTMPGLPMFGHGQIEGFHEKYGMEYRRAYWDEPVDDHLVATHERMVFPLMCKRWLFSGSENFVFYDFFAGDHVDENVFAYSNRVGDERGIILFHNRFGSTAGWIRTSASFAGKGAGGRGTLCRTTIGDALGFSSDDRRYYSFRDYGVGLEYLRSGRELCDRGLFVEFEAYQYHAFLDFREIEDDEFGTWEKLCYTLQGRPVASLAEEAKLVRHADLIALFREVTTDMARLLADPGALAKKKESKQLQAEICRFYCVLALHAACDDGDVETLAAAFMGKLSTAAGIVTHLRETPPPLPFSAADLVNVPVILASWLLLLDAGKMAPAIDYHLTAAAWFDELGLSRALSELVRTNAGDEEPATIDGASLLGVLLARRSFFTAVDGTKVVERCRELFADPATRWCMDCHTSDGIEWFSKERFEFLLAWLALVAALDVTGDPRDEGGTLSGKFDALRRELSLLYRTAGEAGYQPGMFLTLLGPEAR